MESNAPIMNKKDIVDFLWEWANTHGNWAKLLIENVVNTKEQLSLETRELTFNYFLQSLNLYENDESLDEVTSKRPIHIESRKELQLLCLSNVTGINKLAENQTLRFANNLTVIFGENGTGKTGYSRILKNLGFSYDNNNKILSNVFEESSEQKATVNFLLDNEETTYEWNPESSNEHLSNIAVFNNDCVRISLGDKRSLIVSPMGFYLFDLVAEELKQLNKMLDSKMNEYSTKFSCIDAVKGGSEAHRFILGLSSKTISKDLDPYRSFSDEEESVLQKKNKELSVLNKDLLNKDISDLRLRIADLDNAISNIKKSSDAFNKLVIVELNDLNKKINDINKSKKTKIQDIAEKNGILFYDSNEYKNFIESAENYIKKISDNNYPVSGDDCVYCKQSLESGAINLIKSYRALLNDNSEKILANMESKKNTLKVNISSIKEYVKLSSAVFGVDENDSIIQPIELVQYNNKISKLKKEIFESETVAFILDDDSGEQLFPLQYQSYIDFLETKKNELTQSLSKKSDLLKNIAKQENILKEEITDLQEKKLLNSKINEIENIVRNYIVIDALASCKNKFNSDSISRKTTEARKALVESSFEDIFNSEIKDLKKTKFEIDFEFKTIKGVSKVTHKIKAHQLSEILSEGEQKAIALAEFITELQLKTCFAPVIFDDPVNSLDHKIIDAVAKRLLKLSRNRQVVVFTHSILLYYAFLFLKKDFNNNGFDFKAWQTTVEHNKTGNICQANEMNTFKSYRTKINSLLNNIDKNIPEADFAKRCYGNLRSAIELFIQDDVLAGTVKRYQKHVPVTCFDNIKIDKMSDHRENISDIFSRCCGYLEGHSNPLEVYSSPSLEEFRNDWNNLQEIRKSFI